MAYNATPILATAKRPRLGLLSVASLLPPDLDWRRGIRYAPEGCDPSQTYDVCGPGSGPKARPDSDGYSTFRPFIIAATDPCHDPWALDDEHLERANRTLLMSQGSSIARHLLSNTVGNPSLASTATDVSGGAAASWEAAAATLLYHMADNGYVGDVVFHAPSWLEPSFHASGVGDTEDGTRRAYIGAHPVVFDAGYSGLVAPDSLAGVDPAIAAEAGWVYATGPIEYAIGTTLEDVAVSIDERQNDRYVLAERPAIYRFDDCQVFGAVVEVGT
jgi:hypothetical protein